MKKFILILLAICTAVFFICDCGKRPEGAGTEKTEARTSKGNDGDGDLSDRERELLQEAFGEGAELSGDIMLSYQKEALEQLRTAESYLNKKYPDMPLEVVRFATAIGPDRSSIAYVEVNGEECFVKVSADNGGYVCTDTCYGPMIQERYDRELQEFLAISGIDAVTYTTFPIPAGREIDASSTASVLNAQDPPLLRQTDIFIKNDIEVHPKAVELNIKQYLENNGFYGSYILCFVPEMDEMSADNLEENKTEFERTAFNCFK